MKKIVVKCLMFTWRHRYKAVGALLVASAALAIRAQDFNEVAAWLCAIAWMNSERLADKRADESERAVSDLMYILHKVAKGEALASVDGNAITVRPADAAAEGRGWPKEADHA